MTPLTHFSTFTGVGGIDLGLHRAGWTTLAMSEVDPYANAVLAERFPGVPNLGDITTIADRYPDTPADAGGQGGCWERATVERGHQPDARDGEWRRAVRAGGILRDQRPGNWGRNAGDGGRSAEHDANGADWSSALLWSGGFPCQDLSVAGQRRGFGGERSVLAFAFLDLVRSHAVGRGAEWLLLENVPGLLSSHRGADLSRLLCELGDLGYGVAWRVLDARHYHVPQRRRRVFLLATRAPGGRAGAERAAAVLAVAASGSGHPASCGEAREGAPAGVGGSSVAPLWSSEYVGPIDGALGHRRATPQQSVNMGHIRLTGAPPDPDGVQPTTGVPRRVGHREVVGFAQNQRGEVRLTGDTQAQLTAGGGKPGEYETWTDGRVAPTVNTFDVGDTRATTLVAPTLNSNRQGGHRLDADQAESLVVIGGGSDTDRSHSRDDRGSDYRPDGGHSQRDERRLTGEDDPLLPPGLDSHRYRAMGNAVCVPVAEAIGRALAEELSR